MKYTYFLIGIIISAGVIAAVNYNATDFVFEIIKAEFDTKTHQVIITLMIKTKNQLVITTPSSSLFSAHILGDEGKLWGLSTIDLQVVTKHTITSGSHVETYAPTLYQTVQSLKPLALPDSITFEVWMAKSFNTPPYTLNLR